MTFIHDVCPERLATFRNTLQRQEKRVLQNKRGFDFMGQFAVVFFRLSDYN